MRDRKPTNDRAKESALGTTHLELEVSDELLSALKKHRKGPNRAALERVVLSLVYENEISASLGAELLGLSYRDMLVLMADHKIPLISYEEGELDHELNELNKKLG